MRWRDARHVRREQRRLSGRDAHQLRGDREQRLRRRRVARPCASSTRVATRRASSSPTLCVAEGTSCSATSSSSARRTRRVVRSRSAPTARSTATTPPATSTATRPSASTIRVWASATHRRGYDLPRHRFRVVRAARKRLPRRRHHRLHGRDGRDLRRQRCDGALRRVRDATGCTTAGTTCQGTNFRRCSLVDDDTCLDLTIERCGETCNPTTGCVFAATLRRADGHAHAEPAARHAEDAPARSAPTTARARQRVHRLQLQNGQPEHRERSGPPVALDVAGNSIATVELSAPTSRAALRSCS